MLSGLIKSNAKFRIGTTSPAPSPVGPGQAEAPPTLPHDLPRRQDKVAIIGDPRNDENLVIAQLHAAFLKFHNRIMDSQPKKPDLLDELANFTQSEEDRKKTPFHTTRRLVRWHYQFLVLNDFLPRIVDTSTLNDVRANGRKFFNFQRDPFRGRPYMPIEFLGGGLPVRPFHGAGGVQPQPGLRQPVRRPQPSRPRAARVLLPLHRQRRLRASPRPAAVQLDHRLASLLPGGRPLAPEPGEAHRHQARSLHKLPGIAPPEPNDLAVRNLLRGSRLGLPTGQQVAEMMSLQKLTPEQITTGTDGEVAKAHGFHEQTPLWYYILKEADVLAGGKHLGPVGSRIVAEVFVGLLEGDKNSFLAKKKDWMPTLPSATPGTFTISDMLRFVGDVNPLGD